MGFTIQEEIKIDTFGVSVSGAYITFKAGFSQSKSGNSGVMSPVMQSTDPTKPYTLYGRYYIYAFKNASLQPLKEEVFSVNVAVSPVTTLAVALYDALKANKFTGLTFVDDL